MQVSGGGIGPTVAEVMQNGGIRAFWKGIPFGYGRELSYTSVKLGAYAPVRDAIGAGNPDSPFYLKFVAGAITGGFGSILGNPFDVMKTLAQTNKGNESLGGLVTNMYNSQGINGFYRGLQVNILRACILNATKMGCYDLSKGYVADSFGWSRKDPRTVFTSSFIAGLFMTITVAPSYVLISMALIIFLNLSLYSHAFFSVLKIYRDMIRTKLMNQPTDAKLYDGFVDCAMKTVKEGGVTSLWRGFVPIWARFAPQATLQLLTLEALYEAFGFKGI